MDPVTGLFYYFKGYKPMEDSETVGVQLFSYDFNTGNEHVVATIEKMIARDGTEYDVIPDARYFHPDKDVMVFIGRSHSNISSNYCAWLISLSGEFTPVVIQGVTLSEILPIHWDSDAYSYLQNTYYGVKRTILRMEKIINTVVWAALIKGFILAMLYIFSKKHSSKANVLLVFFLLSRLG